MDHCFLTYTYSKVPLEQFYYYCNTVNPLNSTCVYRKCSQCMSFKLKMIFVFVVVHSVEGSAGTFIDPKMNPPTEDQASYMFC